MKREKAKEKTVTLDHLPLRKQAFVKAYVDQSRDTFGNGRKSVEESYPGNKTEKGQAVTAVRLLADSSIQATMQRMIEESDTGTRVQLAALGNIVRGKYLQTVYGVDGEVITSRSPTAGEIAKAVDVLAKLTGHYQRIRVEANVMEDRYKELAKQFRPDRTRYKAHRLKDDGADVESITDAGNVESIGNGDDRETIYAMVGACVQTYQGAQ